LTTSTGYSPAVNIRGRKRGIDGIVYQLYGLTEEEIKLVEESSQR